MEFSWQDFTNLFTIENIITASLSIHFLASAITAITPTQKDDIAVKKYYKFIEALALVVGKAKEK